MTQLSKLFLRFRKDQDGSMAIELLLVVPILLWALLSTFVYFDLFRTESNSYRASLTVADMFSREQTAVDDDYIDGARELLRTLTFSDPDPKLRVTVYRFQGDDDTYRVVWSEALTSTTGSISVPDPDDDAAVDGRLNDSDLNRLDTEDRLPVLASGDRAILIETETRYTAPFDIGLSFFSPTNFEDHTFRTFTVIRPRFNPTLCYDPFPLDDTNTPDC